jgi:hypothetical protein
VTSQRRLDSHTGAIHWLVVAALACIEEAKNCELIIPMAPMGGRRWVTKFRELSVENALLTFNLAWLTYKHKLG